MLDLTGVQMPNSGDGSTTRVNSAVLNSPLTLPEMHLGEVTLAGSQYGTLPAVDDAITARCIHGDRTAMAVPS